MTWTSDVATLHSAGEPLGTAELVVVLVHGRHHNARVMLDLVDRLPALPVSYLALEHRTGQWYPYGFQQPIVRNEPQLSQSLETVASLLSWLAEQGYGSERVVLMGFSQGACLLAEYALRHSVRYAGLVLLIGGAIGPDGTRWDGPAMLAGTPAYLGTSDPDDWVPVSRVRETAAVLAERGASVSLEVYDDLGHQVNDAELVAVQRLIRSSLPG